MSKEEDPLEVVKSKHDLAVSNIPLLMKDGKPHYTFQLHIEYTSPEGARLMRVTTQAMPVTSNRALAESGWLLLSLIPKHNNNNIISN